MLRYDDVLRLPDAIWEANESNKLILFFGAGLSATAGLPTWDRLKCCLVDEALRQKTIEPNIAARWKSKDVDFYKCLESLKRISEGDFREFIRGELRVEKAHDIVEYQKVLQSLAKTFSPRAIINLNVDDLLESNNPYPNFKFVYGKDCSGLHLKNGGFILNIHGGVKQDSWVMTHGDLEGLYKTNNIASLLYSAFCNYTVLFLGFSFRDKKILDFLFVNKIIHEKPLHYSLSPSDDDEYFENEFLLNQHGIEPWFYDNQDSSFSNFRKNIHSWSIDKNPPEIIKQEDEYEQGSTL